MTSPSSSHRRFFRAHVLLPASMLAAACSIACADTVTDWNQRTCDWVLAAELPTPAGVRLMAIVHTASFEAAHAATGRYPASSMLKIEPAAEASLEASIAAAHRVTLGALLPRHRPAIEEAYRTALEGVPDGPAKVAGVANGERAGNAALARAADDGAATREAYRPLGQVGRYVPTAVPAAPQWPQRKPWLLAAPSQFRPAPPPDLRSERWARDYNEIKALGAAQGSTRTHEQTQIARFWETSAAPIYHGLLRSVALQPGRDPVRNARLFAAATQALDDTLIAVFDGKYHYGAWRPVTAIRNGDLDHNDATERDGSWLPLIPTPMHPEYPCAHCSQAAAVASVLQAEVGDVRPAVLGATSPTSVDGAARQWTSLEAFVQEVSLARIYDGVHFRTSTQAGVELGRRVADVAIARHRLGDPRSAP